MPRRIICPSTLQVHHQCPRQCMLNAPRWIPSSMLKVYGVFITNIPSLYYYSVELVPTSSPWDLLPVEIQIKIFAHCGVTDFLPLKLVCKSFYLLLNSQEQWITRQYLRQRRHGTLPSPIDSERTYTRNPEDDAVLLSDLFPPAKSAKGGHIYTFKYISGLRRRQTLCSRLCCYLADRVMDRFVHSEPAFMKSMFTSKAERCVFVQRTTARLWFHLAPLM